MSTFDLLGSHLQANLTTIHQRIAQACEKVGRSPDSVRLVAVTKSVSVDVVRRLPHCGQLTFGENRPQQLIERAALLSGSQEAPLEWHLIGQLQSNKVRSVLPFVCMVHSVDSLSLLERIGRIAGEMSLVPQVLLQVNVSGEESKSGFEPEVLRSCWEQIVQVPNVQLCGLMTMAPLTDEIRVIRRTFSGLRELREELCERTSLPCFRELSMGMSHDFELAVEEGATLVRVGSLLFEGCPSHE